MNNPSLRLFRPWLLVVLAIAIGCAPTPASEQTSGSGPTFDLATLDGGRVASSDFEGKVLLLEFWATWCTPCVAQARILEPIHRDYESRGVEFLAVSLGEDTETVRSYVERSPFPYPVAVDPDDVLSGQLGIFALPTVMIVDRNGDVTYSQPGLSGGDVLRKVLDETVADS